MDKNCSMDSPHNDTGWERLSSQAAAELRPGGHEAGKESPGRRHSLCLPRKRGKWGVGHWRDHRELGEAGGPTEENFAREVGVLRCHSMEVKGHDQDILNHSVDMLEREVRRN